jgi:tetratricopeptide (TPR) repeat protein
MWLIDEAAYALAALDRSDEAIALMRRLGTLPIAANPALIGPAINYGEILWDAGRFADALEHLRRLEAGSAQYANDYGKMWIAAGTTCALASLGRQAEAAPQLARLRAQADVNPAALVRALLCMGDDAAAAAVLVQRLGSDDPQGAILALQDYRLSGGAAQQGPHYGRLIALRDRPEVRAALGRVGRVLSLPLARTSLGGEF